MGFVPLVERNALSGLFLVKGRIGIGERCSLVKEEGGRRGKAEIITREGKVIYWQSGDGSFFYWPNDSDVPTMSGR
jgi:hypothetical protein